jgi:hypothetical protein
MLEAAVSRHSSPVRFLNGVGLGFVLATVSVYIVEIATTDMRGLLGCFVQFQVKNAPYTVQVPAYIPSGQHGHVTPPTLLALC